MKNSQIRLVVILGVIAILGIISVQVYWLRKAYDVKELQFNETIHIALQHVTENLSEQNDLQLSNEEVIRQISSDYFVVDINDVIDANTLEYYLTNEFDELFGDPTLTYELTTADYLIQYLKTLTPGPINYQDCER